MKFLDEIEIIHNTFFLYYVLDFEKEKLFFFRPTSHLAPLKKKKVISSNLPNYLICVEDICPHILKDGSGVTLNSDKKVFKTFR